MVFDLLPFMPIWRSQAPMTYPYIDAYYGGIIAAYGGQPMMHPCLMGIVQLGAPLPTDTVEEPVYVNAKQYHGILRHRQSHAKAELENKLIKSRKYRFYEVFVAYAGCKAILAAAAAALYAYIAPPVARSGIPEVKAYLNGVDAYSILAPSTLFVKDLAGLMDEEDVVKFTEAIKEFDSMTRLDVTSIPTDRTRRKGGRRGRKL